MSYADSCPHSSFSQKEMPEKHGIIWITTTSEPAPAAGA